MCPIIPFTSLFPKNLYRKISKPDPATGKSKDHIQWMAEAFRCYLKILILNAWSCTWTSKWCWLPMTAGYFIYASCIDNIRSPWAAEGGEGAWNLVPSQPKLRHIIWNKLDTTLRNQHDLCINDILLRLLVLEYIKVL